MKKLTRNDDFYDRIFGIDWQEGEKQEITLHPAGGVCCFGAHILERILIEFDAHLIVERELHSCMDINVRVYKHDDLLCIQVIDDQWQKDNSGWYKVDGQWAKVVYRLDS